MKLFYSVKTIPTDSVSMKILSILLILLAAYTSNVQGQNNGNDLCCEEAGQQAGLFCRCRQTCAGNPCNAGQGIGLGGGKYCGNSVCCCGTGCQKSVQSDNCPTTSTPTTAEPTTNMPTTMTPTTNAPTTANPTTNMPTTNAPTTTQPTTSQPTTFNPTTNNPTTFGPTTSTPTTAEPTTNMPTTITPTFPPEKNNEWTIGCPCGLISMWYGSTDYPVGYQLCDGTNGTPNLKGKFIIGSSDGFEAGSTGGSNEITIGIYNLPAHDHDVGTIATSENDGEGSHTHVIYGTATAIEDTLHSHSLTSTNAPISNEAAHTHDIPSLTTTEGEGHYHDVTGSTTNDASHTHDMDFDSQDEQTPHIHTIPAHDTNGGVDDGDHGHFIYAYEDAAPAPASIAGVTYETIGAAIGSGEEINTEGTDDGIHGHNIDEQTTNSNSGHVHQIDGSTDNDGDHSHDIEGGTTGDNDGVHDHTIDATVTGTGSEHGHTISGNTESDGEHTHDVEGGTTGDNDGIHSHALVGKTAMTGSGEAIVYYPPYVALQYICCIRAGPN